MLKKLNIALIYCPVGISEERMPVFQMKKPQIDFENDKNHKLSVFHFSKFLRIFFKIFDWLRGFKFVKWSERKGLVVQWTFLKVFCILKKKVFKLTPKRTNTTKFPNFQRFYAFFPNFRRTLCFGTLKKANKARISCPVVVYEKTKADQKKDKKLETFPIFNVFMQILSNFWQTSWIWIMKTLNMALVRYPVGF